MRNLSAYLLLLYVSIMKSVFWVVISFLFISIAFYSCKKDNAKIICEGDYCFWKMKFDEYDTYFKYYYFDKTGKWVIYEENCKNQIHKLSNLGCQFWDEKWSLRDDTLLTLGGEEYIIKFIRDSIMIITIDSYSYKLYKVDKYNSYKLLQKANIYKTHF